MSFDVCAAGSEATAISPTSLEMRPCMCIGRTRSTVRGNRLTGADWRPVVSDPARLVATAAQLCGCSRVRRARSFVPGQSCLVALAGHLSNPSARPAQPTDLQGAHNKLALARGYREHATVTPTSRKRTSQNLALVQTAVRVTPRDGLCIQRAAERPDA